MNLRDLLPRAQDYLTRADLSGVPGWRARAPFQVEPLAQGEYNMNYLVHQGARVRQGDGAWVLRVNVGRRSGVTTKSCTSTALSNCSRAWRHAAPVLRGRRWSGRHPGRVALLTSQRTGLAVRDLQVKVKSAQTGQGDVGFLTGVGEISRDG